LRAGDWMRTAAGAAAQDPLTVPAPPLDPNFAKNSQLLRLLTPPAPANSYACVQLEGSVFGRAVAANAALTAKITAHDALGIGTPIPVRAGDQLGSIGAAPTDAILGAHGTFLHLEVFSAQALLSGEGYTTVDATDTSVVADREKLYDLLLSKKLLAEEAAGVVLPDDMRSAGRSVDLGRLRSAVVKAKSAWDLDWKALLDASGTFGFMKKAPRDAVGDNMNKYRWWPDVTAAAGLPASDALFHYHPIALLLQLASQP
jgi:hypothetical protein